MSAVEPKRKPSQRKPRAAHEGRSSARERPTRADDQRAAEPESDSQGRRLGRLPLALPLLAALVFFVCAAIASASMLQLLAPFAEEVDVRPAVLVAVPALFAGLFAIMAYQSARRDVTKMAHSLSRALLVALLTWIAFSALATWTWCLPERYGECYRSFLLVTGFIGGGPMLVAAGIAGAVVGWVVLRERAQLRRD